MIVEDSQETNVSAVSVLSQSTKSATSLAPIRKMHVGIVAGNMGFNAENCVQPLGETANPPITLPLSADLNPPHTHFG